MSDLPEIAITLPQNVWQAVEDALCASPESDEIDRALAALKGFSSVEEWRADQCYDEPDVRYPIDADDEPMDMSGSTRGAER